MTLIVLALLGVVIALSSVSLGRVEAYRKASHQAIGEVTGLLGELYGAVLAVKIAGAERRVVTHLESINDRRRRAGVRDQVFDHVVQGMSQSTANLGAGLMLLVGAEAMRGGSFSVGDFALFVSYLASLAQTTSWVGMFLARYKQMTVSLDRVQALIPDTPGDRLVRYAPLHLRHGPPPLPDLARTPDDRLIRLEARGLSYRYPGLRARHRRRRPDDRARQLHRHHRADRQRQDDAGAGAARPACPATAARSAGTARWSTIRARSWCRRASPTPRRCRACSARACTTTS